MIVLLAATGIWIGCFNATPHCRPLDLPAPQWPRYGACMSYLSGDDRTAYRTHLPACRWFYDNVVK